MKKERKNALWVNEREFVCRAWGVMVFIKRHTKTEEIVEAFVVSSSILHVVIVLFLKICKLHRIWCAISTVAGWRQNLQKFSCGVRK